MPPTFFLHCYHIREASTLRGFRPKLGFFTEFSLKIEAAKLNWADGGAAPVLQYK
jgi:hypothetical protein